MNNIKKIYEMLNCENSEEVQNRGIELAKQEDLNFFFQPYSKGIWENCAKIVCSNSDKELEKYIYKMLEWLEDLTWPGALLIFERLNKIPYEKLKTDLYKAISDSIKEERIILLENINELVQDIELKEKNKNYIINYNIEQSHQELKCIPKLLTNLLNNQLIGESLIYLSEFHDPIFLLYFAKYKNSNDKSINFSVTLQFDKINKLMQGRKFSSKSDKEFYKYLFNIINFNYDINHIKNDLNNTDLRLSALRMLNLYNSESLLTYFEKYKNDKNPEIKKAAMLGINNIKYYGY